MALIKGAGPAAEIEKQRRAVRANPRDARAHALLGLALQDSGQLTEAVASQRHALALDAGLPGLHAALGAALQQLGQYAAAIDSYHSALTAQEDDAALHQGLSDAQRQLGQLDAALASAQRAAGLCPGDAQILVSLAAAQYGLHDYEGAAASFRRAIELAPDQVTLHTDLGKTLMHLRRHEEAAACYRRALELEPTRFDAHTSLGACLRELKQFDDAAACYRRALELEPDHPVALYDLAASLHHGGKIEQAHATLERALSFRPRDALVLRALAHACFDMGRWEPALDYARRALEADPSAQVHSVLLFIQSHCCSDPATLTSEHFKFGERWEAPLRGAWQPHPNSRDPERRLQVGFVSADLHQHAVARFVEPVFELLQQSTQLTLHVYYDNTVEDDLNRKLRSHIAHWHPVAGLSDDAVEQQIRSDAIDILIDLHGHSARNRLSLFARKPAPIQASWIGYAGTTGLRGMDYYLGDQFFLPEGRFDDQFTEKIVRLPLAAPFMPQPNSPPVNPLPALANGHLTFGSFHRASKLSREVIALWAQLLRGVPDAKMLLGGLQGGSDTTLLGWFDEEGIDRERLILRQRTGVYEFLAQHHEVDVCLTPFPYSGATTACHALWMGVPTLTTVGPTNPSRAVACYLAHLGLSSFIADDDANFVTLGQFLAQNVQVLAALRASMRERFANSMVGYPGVAAASTELALRLMWQRWCAGMPAESFRVRLSDLSAGSEQEAAA